MKVGRGWLRVGAVAAALAAGLVGCSMGTTTPELSLGAQGVYGSSAVTIGFVVGSADTGITYRAELGRRVGNDYGTVWAAELPQPVETAGTIDLGTLVDGSYRLEVGAEQRRGLGSYELSFLSRVAYFVVDTAAPADPEASSDSGSFDAPFLLFLSHPELLEPAGSAVVIHVTLDGSIPTASSTPYEVGLPLEIASSTQVKAVAVDEAGNSSAVVSWTYTFPPPAAPVVTAITPAILDLGEANDATLRIEGTGFTVGTTVSIPAPGVVKSVYLGSATLLFAVIDASGLAAGALAVTVGTTGGSVTDSSVTLVTTALAITAVLPGAGSVSSASTVIDVYGTGFVVGGSAAAVRDADGTTATQLGAAVLSSTHIALWVNLTTGTGGDGNMTAGAGQLVVTNPDASTATTAFVLGV